MFILDTHGAVGNTYFEWLPAVGWVHMSIRSPENIQKVSTSLVSDSDSDYERFWTQCLMDMDCTILCPFLLSRHSVPENREAETDRLRNQFDKDLA